MCLYTKKRAKSLSKKELTVYKVIDTNGFPPTYSTYLYHEGLNVADETKRSKPEYSGEGLYSVGPGYLHAYTQRSGAESLINILKQNQYKRKGTKYKVVKMKIPPMTPYYLSYDGNEMCSEALFWKKSLSFRIKRSFYKIFY